MKRQWRNAALGLITCLAVVAAMPLTAGQAQSPTPPPPALPFDGVPAPAPASLGATAPRSPAVGGAFQKGADELVAMQAWDGGWGWPLDPPVSPTASPLNTLGPITMGLGKAFEHTGIGTTALQNAGALLLTKTNNFSPSDGYLAAELDSIFGGSTYGDHLSTYFYGPLAAGTYDYKGLGALYDTAGYVDYIRSSRLSQGIPNLAAWDVGMGLVGAAMAGADTSAWIAGTKGEINELDGSADYDVIGLAGALYGLAYVGEEFDPTAGLATLASNLNGMANILSSYQLSTGGFSWSSQYLGEGEDNETIQETAYAVLALNTLDRATYLPTIIAASDYLYSVQLGSGGWEDYTGGGENNEVTGEALWALDAGYPVGDVWVCTSGDCGHPEAYFNTIQEGVDNVKQGGTVHVLAGTYIENVVIQSPLELQGADQATTIIKPAVSDPNCGGGGGGSICSGGSNVILVQADDVTIDKFTIDGDNPSLTSSYNVGGANLDARNGIITDHTTGTFNNLEVHHVTVQNIYLRGIYDSTGSFNFHDNTVTNVQAEYASIAMFAWYGPGTFQDNTVSYANDAISANHSKGIQFLGNVVTHSGSGVHTDNAGDGGGVADLIQGNNISDCMTDGYGIFVFVPYIAPTVNNNTVTNCSVGLSAWGQGAVVTTPFTNNTVDGSGLSGSVGAYITTDWISWGYSDVSVSFTGNTITDNETGVFLTAEDQSWNPGPYTENNIDVTFHQNQIHGNTSGVDKGGTHGTITSDFEHNWWGSGLGPDAPDNSFGHGDSIIAGLDYSPWCSNSACTTFLTGPVADDFDADGRSDPAKYVPAAGAVYYYQSTTSTWGSTYIGTDGDYVLNSDFDGDGVADPAKYVSAAGAVWYLGSSDSTWHGVYVGNDGEYIPASDFDGDGKTDPAKYVATAGAVWYFGSADSTWYGVYIGDLGGGAYVPGSDFDGDGKTDPAHTDSAGNVWYLGSLDSTIHGLYIGNDGPYVPRSDYDGDGITDPAKFATNSVWYLASGNSNTLTSMPLGSDATFVVPSGDFDADGITDPAKFVYSAPHGSIWYTQSSDSALVGVYMGADTYDIVN